MAKFEPITTVRQFAGDDNASMHLTSTVRMNERKPVNTLALFNGSQSQVASHFYLNNSISERVCASTSLSFFFFLTRETTPTPLHASPALVIGAENSMFDDGFQFEDDR